MIGLQNDRLITAPSDEPVSIDTLKLHLRIIGTDEDTELAQYLAAARERVEEQTGRAIVTQTREAAFDSWPCGNVLRFGRGPLASISSVKYLDGDYAEQTWSSSEYLADTVSERPALVLKDAYSWPALCDATGAIRVRYVAGVAQASVPKSVAAAVLFLAAHYYTNREPVNVGNIVNPIPETLDALILSLRIVT